MDDERATSGIIAPASYFTKDTHSYQAERQYRLELAAFGRLKEWLSGYKRRV